MEVEAADAALDAGVARRSDALLDLLDHVHGGAAAEAGDQRRRDRTVVADRACGALAPAGKQQSVRRVRQPQRHRLVALVVRIVGHRDADDLDPLSHCEGERSARAGVVAAGLRRPVGRRVVDFHLPERRAVEAHLELERYAVRLAHLVSLDDHVQRAADGRADGFGQRTVPRHRAGSELRCCAVGRDRQVQVHLAPPAAGGLDRYVPCVRESLPACSLSPCDSPPPDLEYPPYLVVVEGHRLGELHPERELLSAMLLRHVEELRRQRLAGVVVADCCYSFIIVYDPVAPEYHPHSELEVLLAFGEAVVEYPDRHGLLLFPWLERDRFTDALEVLPDRCGSHCCPGQHADPARRRPVQPDREDGLSVALVDFHVVDGNPRGRVLVGVDPEPRLQRPCAANPRSLRPPPGAGPVPSPPDTPPG